jgi:rhamnulokinase
MPIVYAKVPKPRLYALTGLQEMTFNSIFQIVAEQQRRPELLARAQHLLFMPQLLSYQLTGVPAAEYTICSTSGLIDARTRDWSAELLTTLGLPRRLFGDVRMPGVQAGSYQGIPVYLPGGHDTASAVAAVPVTSGGDWAYISSGTWSLIGAELAEPILTPEAMAADFTNEGGIGGRIRFLKNVNGLWLIQECRRMWAQRGQQLSFAEIAAAAVQTPGFRSVIDPNHRRFLAPVDMIAELQAACRESDQPVPQTVGEIARCCYVSLAQAYRRQLDLMAGVTGKRFQRLHIVGGGAQAELLNQLTADACGIPVIAGPVEATALGNLGVQAMANGLFKSLEELRAAVAAAFPVTPFNPRP